MFDATSSESHPAIRAGRVAVVTGAASGIGLAAATRFAQLGMRVVLADLERAALDPAFTQVASVARGGDADVRAIECDVSRLADVTRLRDATLSAFGDVSVVMNNAGTAIGAPSEPWSDLDRWKRLVDVNLWGVVHGVQVFVPVLLAQGDPGLLVNTGSKQGITFPPRDYAYNLSKAGVRVVTEATAFELSQIPGCAVSAHLLIPGYTFTGMTARTPEKPAAAWSPVQVIDFMFQSLARGDFYILCPDNEVTRELDAQRVQWTADDIIRNRPALSRWRPEYKEAFAAFIRSASMSKD